MREDGSGSVEPSEIGVHQPVLDHLVEAVEHTVRVGELVAGIASAVGGSRGSHGRDCGGSWGGCQAGKWPSTSESNGV